MSIVRTPSDAVLRERERKATAAAHQAKEWQYVSSVHYAQTCSKETVTEFINAGPNWWLDEHQAWLDVQIAADTARGGKSVDW